MKTDSGTKAFICLFKQDIDDCTQVKTLSARQLGAQIVQRCGNEGQWPHNTAEQRRTRELLQAAISYIPKAYPETGADLSNTTFYFAIPGCDFAVKAGNGTWEFQFSYNLANHIECQCSNKPMYMWAWDAVSKNWDQIMKILGIAAAVVPAAIIASKKTEKIDPEPVM